MAVILKTMRLMPFGATLAALIWALSTNPLVAPWTERAGRDLTLALDREVARVARPAWIEAALAEAVAEEDAERAEMLIGLAADLGHEMNTTQAERLIASRNGWLASAATCTACMADVATCPSIAMLGACAIPFEMSPLGDANALRRAGVAWWQAEDVDELEAGLAVLGLGATGAALATGGSSLTVKAGTGLLRMARRMGSVTPGLTRMLDVPVAWSRLPDLALGTARLDEIADPARLAALHTVARDLGRIRAATSTGDALRLMRFVDGPDDARHLARIAEAAGPKTGRTLHVLGKGRAIRASMRLTRAATGTLALIWLTLIQAAVLLGTRTGALLLREAAMPRREPVLTRA
ncbi:MAG: hypothetical protein AAGE03_13515 [Pseudomonadota bacterium]